MLNSVEPKETCLVVAIGIGNGPLMFARLYEPDSILSAPYRGRRMTAKLSSFVRLPGALCTWKPPGRSACDISDFTSTR